MLPCPRLVELDRGKRLHAGHTPRRVEDRSLRREGYRIELDHDRGVTVAAAGPAGFFYADATLAQLARIHRGEGLPVGRVEDWPDLEVRGVMLDVSRTKVPTLKTLFGMVDRLASWKVNHLELYMEHTYAYEHHAEVWQHSGPYTAQDLETLGAYCAARHVELVPNQNTLGHMERWLCHERYAPLGIARGVVSGPLGMPLAASTLDPSNPGSLSLVRELIGELGPAVPGSRFHVGLDEPWELRAGRSGEWAQWATKLRAAPELAGREMLVWGDFLASHSGLLGELPDGVTVCEWGYEADHPFGPRSEALSEAGVAQWLCPGTSSWMSVLGRTSNAVANCTAAGAVAASSGGAVEGMLVTDWGDFGHLQYLPVSEPGFATAAAMSWCERTNRHLDAATLGGLLDLHCFDDPRRALSRALVELGDAHMLSPCRFPNMSSLVLNLYLPQLSVGAGLTAGLEPSHLESVSAAIEGATEGLGRSEPRDEHGRVAVAELTNSARLVSLACRDARGRLEVGGRLEDLPGDVRAQLADEMAEVIDEHRRLWRVRNRPEGLEESCEWLEHVRRCYVTGAADAGWAGPLVEMVRRRGEAPEDDRG